MRTEQWFRLGGVWKTSCYIIRIGCCPYNTLRRYIHNKMSFKHLHNDSFIPYASRAFQARMHTATNLPMSLSGHPVNGAWNHRQSIWLKTTDIPARASCRRSIESQTRHQSQNDRYPCRNILPTEHRITDKASISKRLLSLPTSATLFLNYNSPWFF